jgi:hypothetical protein
MDLSIEQAKKYLTGQISWKHFHKAEYIVEGEAFGIEFYKDGVHYFKFHPDKAMLKDLQRIRIQQRMSHKDALQFLESLAYFATYVLSYIYRAPDDLPPENYSKFLCPKLYERYFGVKATHA